MTGRKPGGAQKPVPGTPDPGAPETDPRPDAPARPGGDPAQDPEPDTAPKPEPEPEPEPDPEPDPDAPTAAQLKHAHETGALRDKVAYPDPGAAPLGVDDEAAGRPTWREPERVAMAQTAANKAAAPDPARPAAAPDPDAPPIPRADTSGRFQFAVMAGALVIIIVALLARMALG